MAGRQAGDKNNPRVTFMVNIWLDYKPVGMSRFPEELVKHLRKEQISVDFSKIQADEKILVQSEGSVESYKLHAPFGRDKKVHLLSVLLPLSCLAGSEGRSISLAFKGSAATLGKNVEKRDRKSMLASLKALSKAKKQKSEATD